MGRVATTGASAAEPGCKGPLPSGVRFDGPQPCALAHPRPHHLPCSRHTAHYTTPVLYTLIVISHSTMAICLFELADAEAVRKPISKAGELVLGPFAVAVVTLA